jgi:hypothetical protein
MGNLGKSVFSFSWRDSHGEKRQGRRAAIHFRLAANNMVFNLIIPFVSNKI